MVMDIALGIVLGYALLAVFKRPIDGFLRWLWKIKPLFSESQSEVTDRLLEKGGDLQELDAQDWLDLWSSAPESAKDQVQRCVDDDQLRCRVQQCDQDLGLWPFLWAVAPEETKDKIRCRWRVSGSGRTTEAIRGNPQCVTDGKVIWSAP